MATAFTHAFVGVAFGVAAPASVPRVRLASALAFLAVLPDLDVVGFSVGISYHDWLGHRGFLHSVPFALLAGLATATLLFPEPPRGSREWWRVALLLTLAGASHGVLDAFTDAGLGVGFWLPFDETRSFFPWRPLPTSPLGVGAFFRGPAAAILWEEFTRIWLPVGMLAGTLALLRRSAARRLRPAGRRETLRRRRRGLLE